VSIFFFSFILFLVAGHFVVHDGVPGLLELPLELSP
jgi:hypothetical protein